MANSFSKFLIGSEDIVDGSILNVDINAAAAVAASKLVLSAIAQDIIPNADGTRDVGSVTKKFNKIWMDKTNGFFFDGDIVPANDNTKDIGTSSLAVKLAYINELGANSIGQIMFLSLLGG